MVQFDNAVKRFGDLILEDLHFLFIEAWIAGGSVRDYFLGNTEVSDFDLFFPNQQNYDRTLKYFKDGDCNIIYEGDNGVKLESEGRVFDLVNKFFSSPQETIDAFDFTVSMFAVDLTKVYHGETSFIDLAKKQLMFNKITYPASSLKRSFRYYTKGFRMCHGEMKKITEALYLEGPNYIQEQAFKKSRKTEPVDQPGTENEETSGDGFFAGID